LKVLRLGLQRDAASGSHAALLLMPLQSEYHAELAQWRQRFMSQLPALLAGELKRLDTELVWLSLRGGPVTHVPDLDEFEHRELDCFAHHHKPFELCQATLQRWLLRRVMMLDALSQDERRLLIATLAICALVRAGCPTGCRGQTRPDKSIALPAGQTAGSASPSGLTPPLARQKTTEPGRNPWPLPGSAHRFDSPWLKLSPFKARPPRDPFLPLPARVLPIATALMSLVRAVCILVFSEYGLILECEMNFNKCIIFRWLAFGVLNAGHLLQRAQGVQCEKRCSSGRCRNDDVVHQQQRLCQ
jgi:hypothetical protein